MKVVVRPRPAVGVLGGTFDPVHFGHLHLAECVRRAFLLSRVLLVPCAFPPHKRRDDLTPADRRFEMLRLALEDHEGIEICSLELDRGGVSYTLPTLRALREAPYHVDPLLIVGLDALAEIASWYSYEALLAEFDIVAVDRPGHDAESVRRALPACVAERWVDLGGPVPGPVPVGGAPLGTGGRVLRLQAPPVPISSSDIRKRAASGLSLNGLVPPPVARYIQLRRLYRQEDLR